LLRRCTRRCRTRNANQLRGRRRRLRRPDSSAGCVVSILDATAGDRRQRIGTDAPTRLKIPDVGANAQGRVRGVRSAVARTDDRSASCQTACGSVMDARGRAHHRRPPARPGVDRCASRSDCRDSRRRPRSGNAPAVVRRKVDVDRVAVSKAPQQFQSLALLADDAGLAHPMTHRRCGGRRIAGSYSAAFPRHIRRIGDGMGTSRRRRDFRPTVPANSPTVGGAFGAATESWRAGPGGQGASPRRSGGDRLRWPGARGAFGRGRGTSDRGRSIRASTRRR